MSDRDAPGDEHSVWSLGSVDVFSVRSNEVSTGASRLEAAFYGSEGYRAVQALRGAGFDLVGLDTVARVEWFGPFSRAYVDGPEHGVSFVSSAEMLEARLVPDHWLSRKLTPRIERLLVRDGQLLVS